MMHHDEDEEVEMLLLHHRRRPPPSSSSSSSSNTRARTPSSSSFAYHHPQYRHGGSGGGGGGGPPWRRAWRGGIAFMLRLSMLPSLADKWTSHATLFGVLLSSPVSAALLLLALYGVILVLWVPLYVLALLISTPGVYLTVGGGLYYLGRTVARSLTFPGTLPNVLRGLEQEYSAQTVRKLDHCIGRIKEWAIDLRLLHAAAASSLHLPTPSRLGRTHLEVSFMRKHLLSTLRAALGGLVDDEDLSSDRLKKELKLSDTACRLAYQVKRVLGNVVWGIDAALPFATQRVGSSSSSSSSSSSLLPSPTLLADTDKALELLSTALEELHRLLPQLAPPPTHPPPPSQQTQEGGGGGGGLWEGLKGWYTAKYRRWDNILGLHLMREELCQRWKVGTPPTHPPTHPATHPTHPPTHPSTHREREKVHSS